MSTAERLLACRNVFGHPGQNFYCWITTGLRQRFRSFRSNCSLLSVYSLAGTFSVLQIKMSIAERLQACRNVFVFFWIKMSTDERLHACRNVFSLFQVKITTADGLLTCRNVFSLPDQNVHYWPTTDLPVRFRSSRSKCSLLNDYWPTGTFSVFLIKMSTAKLNEPLTDITFQGTIPIFTLQTFKIHFRNCR